MSKGQIVVYVVNAALAAVILVLVGLGKLGWAEAAAGLALLLAPSALQRVAS